LYSSNEADYGTNLDFAMDKYMTEKYGRNWRDKLRIEGVEPER